MVRAKWLEQTVPYSELPREVIYKLARDVDHPESEAIFISCVALHTADLIEDLESDIPF